MSPSFTEGRSMVPAGSNGVCATDGTGGKTRHRNEKKMKFRIAVMSLLLSSGKSPGQSQAQLANGLVSVVRPANSDIERQTVADAPDRADERRRRPGAPGRLLAEDL